MSENELNHSRFLINEPIDYENSLVKYFELLKIYQNGIRTSGGATELGETRFKENEKIFILYGSETAIQNLPEEIEKTGKIKAMDIQSHSNYSHEIITSMKEKPTIVLLTEFERLVLNTSFNLASKF